MDFEFMRFRFRQHSTLFLSATFWSRGVCHSESVKDVTRPLEGLQVAMRHVKPSIFSICVDGKVHVYGHGVETEV